MTDLFRQGIDYGPRDGTLGLSFHMSEGGDGLVGFLAQRNGETRAQWIARTNGVSCHVALLSNGALWQMLGWSRACGNLNPADRAGETGYYGGSHLRAVLGSHWTDPNAWTLSMEIAGRRADGPTRAQVEAAVRWGLAMRQRFPTIRGAVGHHDQSPKPCPGLTPNMKEIFARVGGHGLWGQEVDMPGLTITDLKPAVGIATVKDIPGVKAVQVDDPRQTFTLVPGTPKDTVAIGRLVGDPLGKDGPGSDRHTVRLIGAELAVVLDGQVDWIATSEFNAGVESAAQKALEAKRP